MIMNLKQTIKRILREESSAKTRLKNVIEKLGPLEAVNAVGSAKKMFEIMELDYNDVEVQEYIVKNYIYHNEFEEVLFLEVNRVSPSKTIIKSNIKPDTAANHTSWFDSVICDNFNRVFPFKIEPVWNFEWAKDKKTKIFVESETSNEEENINESNKDKKITCDNCGWSWKLSEGGDDPYTCHKCWNENQMIESELTEKCWKGYTQKGMKTMFGKRYPNCVKNKKK